MLPEEVVGAETPTLKIHFDKYIDKARRSTDLKHVDGIRVPRHSGWHGHGGLKHLFLYCRALLIYDYLYSPHNLQACPYL